ncbi:hypothetical protein FYK55_00950 [Roseiconus nitratireducens]|uniref:HNH endonuclease n=1 Tax=Roseiconus nitratireducens TaxID=2605748 RepID=A0A5M6DHK3_9BACT|nr:hypothetical protein [Roseiconus nitratireducens]KAA5547018.1 hypothetical protein FYK55_00950 [Roseiconus nitratireducens]
MSKIKICPRCDRAKARDEFVNIYGHANPRGKYCRSCFDERELEHVRELMDGRDFCLYCGKRILRYCEWNADGRSTRTFIHRDHMDPVSGGGHDEYGVVDLETGTLSEDDRNLVYCCAECNLKKGEMPFLKWLERLAPEFQKLARRVYAEKHDGKQPEQFVPGEDIVIVIRIDNDD